MPAGSSGPVIESLLISLCRAAERTVEATWQRIGALLLHGLV